MSRRGAPHIRRDPEPKWELFHMTKSTKIAKTVARNVAKPAATKSAPAPVTIAARSAYIVMCGEMGVLPKSGSGDGLPMREMFRNRLRAAGKWVNGTTQWGPHNYVTDLHRHCIATAVARLGNDATPAARKFADGVFATMGRDFDPTQWDIDVAAHRATFRGAAKSAPSSRKRRAA